MVNFIKRIIWGFLLVGGMILTWGWVLSTQAEDRPSEVRIPGKALPEDSLINMDFQDVDLNIMIRFMGELTGEEFSGQRPGPGKGYHYLSQKRLRSGRLTRSSSPCWR